MVGRGRLSEVCADGELCGRDDAGRSARFSGTDGEPLSHFRLHRRGEVRNRLAAEDVGRLGEDALLPGWHRNGFRGFRLSERSRYLAAAAGGRHLCGQRSDVSIYSSPTGVCGGGGGREERTLNRRG